MTQAAAPFNHSVFIGDLETLIARMQIEENKARERRPLRRTARGRSPIDARRRDTRARPLRDLNIIPTQFDDTQLPPLRAPNTPAMPIFFSDTRMPRGQTRTYRPARRPIVRPQDRYETWFSRNWPIYAEKFRMKYRAAKAYTAQNWDIMLVGTATGAAARTIFWLAGLGITASSWWLVIPAAIMAGATSSLTKTAIAYYSAQTRGTRLEEGWWKKTAAEGFIVGFGFGALGGALVQFALSYFTSAVSSLPPAEIVPTAPVTIPPPALAAPPLIPPEALSPLPMMENPSKLYTFKPYIHQFYDPPEKFAWPADVPPVASAPLVTSDVKMELKSLMDSGALHKLPAKLHALGEHALHSGKPAELEHFFKEASYQLIDGRHHNPASRALGAQLIELGIQLCDEFKLTDLTAHQLYRDLAYLELYGKCNVTRDLTAALAHAQQAGVPGQAFVNQIHALQPG